MIFTLRLTIVCSALIDLRTDDDRIDPEPGHRSMGLTTCDEDFEPITCRHEWTAPARQMCRFEVPPYVQPEDRVDLRVQHDPFLDHQFRARWTLGRGRCLLCGLKDKLHGTRQPLPQLRQNAGLMQQDRHVAVVTEGMHHADLLSFGLCDLFAGKRTIDVFTNRQAIHVGAECDDRAWASPAEERHDASPRDICLGLETEAAQPFGNVTGGLEFTVRDSGMLIQISPPLDLLRLEGRRKAIDVDGDR